MLKAGDTGLHWHAIRETTIFPLVVVLQSTDLLIELDVKVSGRNGSFALGERVPRLVAGRVCRRAVDRRQWRLSAFPLSVLFVARVLDDTLQSSQQTRSGEQADSQEAELAWLAGYIPRWFGRQKTVTRPVL